MLKPVDRVAIPPGTKVTPHALMPKVVYVVEDGVYKVYRNRRHIRTFKQMQNAIKKMNKIADSERKAAQKILEKLSNPVIMPKKSILIKKDENIGFYDAI